MEVYKSFENSQKGKAKHRDVSSVLTERGAMGSAAASHEMIVVDLPELPQENAAGHSLNILIECTPQHSRHSLLKKKKGTSSMTRNGAISTLTLWHKRIGQIRDRETAQTSLQPSIFGCPAD
jgi:hypothetical protein